MSSPDLHAVFYSSLSWEEHLFVLEDRAFSILIVSFMTNEKMEATKSEDLYLEIIALTTRKISAMLYPAAFMYKDTIKNVTVIERQSHPTEIAPQKVAIIRIAFLDTIRDYGRYSLAVLMKIDNLVSEERPFLTGNFYRKVDYSIYLHSPESRLESVPIGRYSNISQIYEGIRSESEFPRLTVTLPKRMKLDSVTPPQNTRFDGIPYSYGICQEKRNGDALHIHTGLLPAVLVSHNASVKAGETMTVSFSTWPFIPDRGVEEIIGNLFDNANNLYTIGWIEPPSHIYLENRDERRDLLISDILAVLTVLGILVSAAIWLMKRRRERKEEKKKRRRRSKRVRE